MRRWYVPGVILLGTLALGCHREVEMLPLIERTIYITDKFYDVQALSKDRAFVVGYGGKVLETTNGGYSWTQRDTGLDNALYSIKFTDDTHGWITGQDGLILHTSDGGQHWEKQTSNAAFKEADGSQVDLYLFALDALDNDHAWAVGDRSILTSTEDGGKTWTARKIPMETDTSGGESMASADPIFYDVKFLDRQRGWIVGEFGKIMHTDDGGATWKEQEKSLLSGGSGFVDLLDLPTMFGIQVMNPQEQVAAGLEGHIARTTNGGQQWGFDDIQVDYKLEDPLFRVKQFPDGSGWAVGSAGEVLRREAGETAWKRAKLGQDISAWIRGLSFSDQQNGWMVGGFGLIFRTTDGGKTWLPAQG
jgi:photosystem II stability/assembly factor-like uncharacterized protein